MKLAIMQPYFMPYIGYYQLLAAVDVFVIYDNIKYTKKGWINRNRMLLNGADLTFTLPLKKASNTLDVVDRELATDFNRSKLLNQFKGAYSRAPYFAKTFQLIERIVRYEDINLFRYIYHSLVETCAHIGIETDIYISSEVDINHNLKGQDKVLAFCRAMDADIYINAIGGIELYSREDFSAHGIKLKFIKPRLFEYPQFDATFVPWLSIVDVLMFNPLDTVCELIKNKYELI